MRASRRTAIAVAARHGVDITGLRARQVTRDDFTRFDHIVALDHDNLSHLRRLAPAQAEIGPDDPSSSGLRFRPTQKATAGLSLLLDHVPAARARRSPTPGSATPKASTSPGPR